jgi:hypothetical protein
MERKHTFLRLEKIKIPQENGKKTYFFQTGFLVNSTGNLK